MLLKKGRPSGLPFFLWPYSGLNSTAESGRPGCCPGVIAGLVESVLHVALVAEYLLIGGKNSCRPVVIGLPCLRLGTALRCRPYPFSTMYVVLLFHRIAFTHPDACARWQVRQFTWSFALGPFRFELLLFARAARVAKSPLLVAKGTRER